MVMSSKATLLFIFLEFGGCGLE